MSDQERCPMCGYWIGVTWEGRQRTERCGQCGYMRTFPVYYTDSTAPKVVVTPAVVTKGGEQ